MPQYNLRFWIYIFIILLSSGIFYSLSWKNAPVMAQDSPGYIRVAEDLQDLKLDKLHGRTPGYPFLLLLTNSLTKSTRAIFSVQLVLHLVSISLLVYLLTYLKIPKRFIFLFLFLSLVPPNVDETSFILTETLTQFLLVVGCFFMMIWMKQKKMIFLVVSSIVFSLSALVRPTYQLLFVVISLLFLLNVLFFQWNKYYFLKSFVVLFIISTFILGGFAYYNYLNFDYFGLTYRFGIHFSTKTVRIVEKLPDEYAEVRKILIDHRNKALVNPNSIHTGENYIYRAIPDLKKSTGLSEKDLSSYLVKLNLIMIKNEPRHYLVDVARSMVIFWFPSNTAISNFNSKIIELLWSILNFITIGIFLILLLIFLGFVIVLSTLKGQVKNYIVEFLRSDKIYLASQCLVMSIIIIIYTMFISTMFDVGSPRQRAPTDLLIFLTISVGLYYFDQVRKNLSKIGDEIFFPIK